MDIEPLEAVLGILLISAALIGALSIRPQLSLHTEYSRDAVARSLASVYAYYYVHKYAYGSLNGTELNATLANWTAAVSIDSGLNLTVELLLSNGTDVVGNVTVFRQPMEGDTSIIEKPAPVYTPPNGTRRGYVVLARDVYRYGTEDLKMDYMRAYAVYVDLPSGTPLEAKNTSVEVNLPFRDCAECVGAANCTSCPPDHTLSGNASELNLTYFFEDRLDPIEYCWYDNGSVCVTSPYVAAETDTATFTFVYDPGIGGLNIVAQVEAHMREKNTVPNRPWVEVNEHLLMVGDTLEITYGVVANLTIYRLTDGKVLIFVPWVSDYDWNLTNPLEVAPGPCAVYMVYVDDEYNSSNAIIIAPYILIVKVVASGGV